jgi:uncharacterized membrane protein
MALVLLGGFASGQLIESLGVRTAALLLFVVATAAAAGLGTLAIRGNEPLSVPERFAILGTLTLAIATGSGIALGLVPAIVHALVARVLLASLDGGESLIEKAARISQPLAPRFIGPYCRRLTAVWAGLFGASAIVTAVLAIGGATAAHRAWTGWMFWSALGLFSFAEFFFRKAWFRYYGPGPLDRVLARIFPQGNTTRGRRSAAYVARMREELATRAEAKRAGRANGAATPRDERA